MNGNIEYETGQAPVNPGPPFLGAAMKAEGFSSDPPPGAGRPWQAAGPPPAGRRGMPTWAIVVIVVGAVLVALCCGTMVVGAALGDDDPEQTSPTVAAEPETETEPETEPETETPAMPPVSQPEVEVTGKCEKKIIGNYGLLASVTVDNPTDQEVSGTVWVSWDVLGDDPYVFSEEVSVAPGESISFHVDEEIDSGRWFQVERDCQYGFRDSTD